MHQAFIINLLIVGIIVFGIAVTSNPLFLMGLLLLQNMPFIPPGYSITEDDDEIERAPAIGFLADVGGGDDDPDFDE